MAMSLIPLYELKIINNDIMRTKTIIIIALLINGFIVKAQHQIEVLDSFPDGTIKLARIQSKVKS